ncbi:MAG: SGNH/GDSL hydrolase family protein [Candidatus Hydrogenedentes bacterium]|nr:SGNH/GDSL hydrolase family protein [Candidatus Hydrogenedentota bacterium]
MKKIKQLIINSLLVIASVISLFAILEGTARIVEIWKPPMQVDIGQGFGAESLLFLPIRGGFMETNPDKSFAFHSQRFEMPKPLRTMRIFALGGSSVNYLDYEFTCLAEDLQRAWSEQVDTVEIINCGGLSYGTHRLVLIMAEIIHYNPDLVIIYSGHNEFEELQQLHLANLDFASAQRVLGRTALYRFMRDMRTRSEIVTLQQARQRRELATAIPDTSTTWAHVFTAEEMEARMDAYRNNLAAIIRKCQDKEVPVIIGTVPSNLYKPNLPGSEGKQYEEVVRLFDGEHYKEGVVLGQHILRNATPRHQSSEVENNIICHLSEEFHIPLARVESAIIQAEPNNVPGETLFGDHCHLNAAGNTILRMVYQKVILDIFCF